jgi:hypothetical protein
MSRNYFTCRLVAEYVGAANHLVSDATVHEVVDVGTAHAHCAHPHERLADTGNGIGQNLKALVADTVQDRGLHFRSL